MANGNGTRKGVKGNRDNAAASKQASAQLKSFMDEAATDTAADNWGTADTWADAQKGED